MIKHTQGPWRTEKSSRTDIYIISDSIKAKNKWVATACNHEFHPTTEENERNIANARLIAAAPELLDALEAALTQMEQMESMFENDAEFIAALEMVRNAIEKATS